MPEKKKPTFGGLASPGMDELSIDSEEVKRQNKMLEEREAMGRENYGRKSADDRADIAKKAREYGGIRSGGYK